MTTQKNKKHSVWGWVLVGFGALLLLTKAFSLALLVLLGGCLLIINKKAKVGDGDKEVLKAKASKQRKYLFVSFVIAYFSFSVFNYFQNLPAEEVKTVVSPEQKQKDLQTLKETMAILTENKLATSYEFSENANVVYVSGKWYGLTAQEKKELLTSIGNVKDVATGYRWFEVRDAYSDELVAKVTAFTGSVEIYK